tara:strand:+ start:1624 stop:2559 length:936 start_codon:yes stop_codon:yes gene_type:complete
MNTLDEQLIKTIHDEAFKLATEAGKILSGYFGKQISIQFKDKSERDPVTSADTNTQQYLEENIKTAFPTHTILGEETTSDTEQSLDKPASDFVWVLDPLDGTTNFMNGIPIYASSIGVLYQGVPIVGAIYIPWPGKESGLVIHSKKGTGCYANSERVYVADNERPIGNRLIGLPGSFSHSNRFKPGLKGPTGEPRVTGSIAYELAMTAMGVFQYSIFGAPRMWDMLGGTIAVQEAGGTVMTKPNGSKDWEPIESLYPLWNNNPPTIRQLRNWVAPIVAGNSSLAPLISQNITNKFQPISKITTWSKKITSS